MIKFAVIGTNFITDSFIESARLCKDFELRAVYSRTKSRGEEYAKKYNITTIFDDLQDLALSKEIDAIYIASPNCYHKAQAIQMLKAKKHVLCEKPIASNSRELEEMCNTAQENNVILLEAMRSEFSMGLTAVKDNLYKLGDIRRATFNYCQYSSRYDKFKNGIIENAFNPSFSNGSIMDIGIYCVYALVRLFGMPENINATAIILDNGIDGAGTITADYNSMQAELLYSKITNSYNPSEIQGEKGCMLIKSIGSPQEVKIIYNTGEVETVFVEQQKYDMYYEIKEFIRLIQSDEQSEIYNKYSKMCIKLIDNAREIIGIIFPADK